MRRFLCCLLLVLSATTVRADDLRASSTRVHADETVQVVVTLSATFAEVDAITLPMKGLVVEGGGPSVESSFAWINGVSKRQKIFRYTLRPEGIGTATVGPVTIRAEGGQTETLPQIAIEIIPDLVGASFDPAELLRSYAASGRERVCIVPEVSTMNARTGQQIVVTWQLYTAEAVDNLSLSSLPAMSDFWVEEIPLIGREESEVLVDGDVVKRVAVRRVALFPLRSGELRVEPIAIVAEVLRGSAESLGGFGIFNATPVQVRRRSATVILNIAPAANTAVAVGEHTLRCTRVRAGAEGPAAFEMILRGTGNLRSITPPRFLGPVEAEVQVTDGGVKVARSPSGVVMERRWAFLLFPKRSGQLLLPSAGIDVFDSKENRGLTLECSFGAVEVQRVSSKPEGERSSASATGQLGRRKYLIALLTAALVIVAVLTIRSRKRARARRELESEADALLATPSPRELRRALEALFQSHGGSMRAVMNESSERGELVRAVSSLIDFREKNRGSSGELTGELREQLIELIRELRQSDRKA